MTITKFLFFGINDESANFESESFNVYQGIEPDLYYCKATLDDGSVLDLPDYPINPFEYCGCDCYSVEVIGWGNNWTDLVTTELFGNYDDAREYASDNSTFTIEQIDNNSFINNGVQCIVRDMNGVVVFEPEPLRIEFSENEYTSEHGYTSKTFFVAPTIKIEGEYYNVDFPVRQNRGGDIKYIHLENGDVLRHHVWCSEFDLKKVNGELICNVKVNLG